MKNSKITYVEVIVHTVKRGRVSAMGNPSYVFNTDHGPYRTQTDSGAAYGLENDFTVGVTLDLPAKLALNPQGRVTDWEV